MRARPFVFTHRPRDLAIAIAALASCGCFGGIGPQVGMTFEGRPTLGWEVSAATLAVGQSFAVGAPGRQGVPDDDGRPPPEKVPTSWDRRTYFVWEPRFGAPVGPSQQSAALLAGGGVSLGLRWDHIVVSDLETREASGFLGGLWLGATDLGGPLSEQAECSSLIWHGYASIALGIRGDEVYLSPKLGVVGLPQLCLDFGDL